MLNKKLVAALLAMSMAAPVLRAEDSSDEFYGIRRDSARYQAIAGSAEAFIGTIMAAHAMSGPGKIKSLPTNTKDLLLNAKNAELNSIARKEALEKFMEGRGKGVIRSVELIGTALIIREVGGRVFQWFGTDSKPSWSPLYDAMVGASQSPLDAPAPVTGLKAKSGVPSTVSSQPTLAEIPKIRSHEEIKSNEDKLRKELKSRSAKALPQFKKGATKDLNEHFVDLRKQMNHEAKVAKDEENNKLVNKVYNGVADFYNTDTRKRPESESMNTAQSILFGGDLLAGSLLGMDLLFNGPGNKAVKAAEQSLKKVKALSALTRGDSNAISEVLSDLRLQKSTQESLVETYKRQLVGLAGAQKKAMETLIRTSSETLNKTLAEIAKLSVENPAYIGKEALAAMTADAEANLANTRALATSAGKGAKFFTGMKVVGGVFFATDILGRVYEWHSNDANPKLSPALTWMSVYSQKPRDVMWNEVAGLVDHPSKYFENKYNKVNGFFNGSPKTATPVVSEKPTTTPVQPAPELTAEQKQQVVDFSKKIGEKVKGMWSKPVTPTPAPAVTPAPELTPAQKEAGVKFINGAVSKLKEAFKSSKVQKPAPVFHPEFEEEVNEQN